ncbi:MAG: rhomboid family intramembrane serine protease [bacterium]
MIPFKDDNPTERYPVVTVGLIVLNVLVYLYQLSLGGQGQEEFFKRMGAIPYEISRMVDIGPAALIPIPLTVISAMFMHGGLMHLGGNMLYLWIFGDNVEDAMGRVRFLLFYLICGVAASGLHIVVDPSSRIPMVGASGAIAGVLGAYLLLYPQARVYTLLFLFFFIQVVRLPALYVLGFWFLLQVLYGLPSLGGASSGGVAWFAHIGGFAAGMILIKGFARPRPAKRMWYFR